MWDGQVERRQTLTSYLGMDRRGRSAAGPEWQPAPEWASQQQHQVPLHFHRKAPHMAHWQTPEELDLWE